MLYCLLFTTVLTKNDQIRDWLAVYGILILSEFHMVWMIWIPLGFEHYLMGTMRKLQTAAKYFVQICIHLNLSRATCSHLRHLKLPNTSIVKQRLKNTSWAANTDSVTLITRSGPVTLYIARRQPTVGTTGLRYGSHTTRDVNVRTEQLPLLRRQRRWKTSQIHRWNNT